MSAIKALHFAAAAFMLVTGTFLCGAFCASIAIHDSQTSIELAKVSGRITCDGAPVPNLLVSFDPLPDGRGGEGFTDADGRYELSYTFEKQGAWVGRHRVTIARGGPQEKVTGDHHQAPLYSCEVDVRRGIDTVDFELPALPQQ